MLDLQAREAAYASLLDRLVRLEQGVLCAWLLVVVVLLEAACASLRVMLCLMLVLADRCLYAAVGAKPAVDQYSWLLQMVLPPAVMSSYTRVRLLLALLVACCWIQAIQIQVVLAASPWL